MITAILTSQDNPYDIYELRGLSSDTKPTDKVGNGSIFLEMDTTKIFIYNSVAQAWVELQ